jgi:hypothetical protein
VSFGTVRQSTPDSDADDRMPSTMHRELKDVHLGLNQQIIAVGGHHVLMKEARRLIERSEIVQQVMFQ